MLLAVDPGANSGWALFDTTARELLSCGLDTFDVKGVAEAIIEHPFVYPRGRTKDPNAIVKLAINAGEWGGRLRDAGAVVRYVLPVTWKGTVPKDITHARAWAKLKEAERAIVDKAGKKMPASKRHNMLDAVALGLYGLGR